MRKTVFVCLMLVVSCQDSTERVNLRKGADSDLSSGPTASEGDLKPGMKEIKVSISGPQSSLKLASFEQVEATVATAKGKAIGNACPQDIQNLVVAGSTVSMYVPNQCEATSIELTQIGVNFSGYVGEVRFVPTVPKVLSESLGAWVLRKLNSGDYELTRLSAKAFDDISIDIESSSINAAVTVDGDILCQDVELIARDRIVSVIISGKFPSNATPNSSANLNFVGITASGEFTSAEWTYDTTGASAGSVSLDAGLSWTASGASKSCSAQLTVVFNDKQIQNQTPSAEGCSIPLAGLCSGTPEDYCQKPVLESVVFPELCKADECLVTTSSVIESLSDSPVITSANCLKR